ncbi:MAG: hypothetical protein LBN38_04045 [Verrucomicrobiota bacterium]|jgi:hypothetical protein|nr:hypothetical protein [Verrucomicrobiota bacterium]
MFFPFCSDRLYDRDRWPLVWEIEKTIQALVLADLPTVRSATSDMLKSMIRDLFHTQKASLLTDGYRDDMQWIDVFLDTEIPLLREFLTDLPTDMHDFPAISQIREYRLMPNENLSICMRDSDVFRTYIQESARLS